MDVVLRWTSRSLRKRFAEHGEAALRLVLRRLILHHVPVLREASCLDADDVHDDPCRPPTAAEAAVHHDVIALGDCERAFVSPGEAMDQREKPVPPGCDPRAVLDIRGLPVPL